MYSLTMGSHNILEVVIKFLGQVEVRLHLMVIWVPQRVE